MPTFSSSKMSSSLERRMRLLRGWCLIEVYTASCQMIILSSSWTRDLQWLTTIFSGSALGFKLIPEVDLTPDCCRCRMFSHFGKTLWREEAATITVNHRSRGAHGCSAHFYLKKTLIKSEDYFFFIRQPYFLSERYDFI